jgi:hypothetical protein
MVVSLSTLGIFVLALVAQVIVWRIWLPPRQTPALLVLFLVVPMVVVVTMVSLGRLPTLAPADAVRALLFYVPSALAYTILYSSFEMQSPTLMIVSYLAAARGLGRTEPELRAHIGQDTPLEQRLRIMIAGGLLSERGGVLSLSGQGQFFAQLFEIGARVFGVAQAIKRGG